MVEQVEQEVLPVTAGLDISKAEVVCCVRVPTRGRGRVQRVQRFSTMSPALLDLGQWLRQLGVERVVMEATGQYWKPVYFALEACGFSPWLVNARDVTHLPGRAKTDTLDAAWLCKVAERGMLRPSFVPPAPIRRLRAVTRYRSDLIGERTRERSRVLDLLEDAGVKISLVASDGGVKCGV
jgi:transposase